MTNMPKEVKVDFSNHGWMVLVSPEERPKGKYHKTIKYHHDDVVKAKDARIAELEKRVDTIHAALQQCAPETVDLEDVSKTVCDRIWDMEALSGIERLVRELKYHKGKVIG